MYLIYQDNEVLTLIIFIFSKIVREDQYSYELVKMPESFNFHYYIATVEIYQFPIGLVIT